MMIVYLGQYELDTSLYGIVRETIEKSDSVNKQR